MRVLKFGGSSVGTAESLRRVKQIIEERKEPVIVVVSALGGITDRLIMTSQMAAGGDLHYTEILQEIIDKHTAVIHSLFPVAEEHPLLLSVQQLIEELRNILQGLYLIRDLSEKTQATILSYGERISSLIVSELVDGAIHYDARTLIKTEKKQGKHSLAAISHTLIREVFHTLPTIGVLGGFISTDYETGEVTNLGRGGSDYTAAIIAATLHAEMLEIWTDVDGFMTADPRTITTAYPIAELSYSEAMELCNFGAKVIYPPTIYPVCHERIPILIKNTFNPTAPGTIVKDAPKESNRLIRGISSIQDTCMITMSGLGMVGVIGINYRIFRSLAKNDISVFMVSQASSENSTSIGVRSIDGAKACKVLDEEFSKEISMGEINPMQAEYGLATVAVVGENMKNMPGIMGKLFGTLGRNGISVIACAQGAAQMNISFVIEEKLLRKALNVLHDSFFLSEYQVLNLFICGIGTVGSKLIEQIRTQQEKLKSERRFALRVVGIANGRKVYFDRKGIPLENYRELLEEQGQASSPAFLSEEIIGMNLFNSVFVDCTASADIAHLYQGFLSHNISVVTANKIAASSAYRHYRTLKETSILKGVKFLFETNVGAGLPIINTINALINSGDKIEKIEAVVSGTLNYIFNTLSTENPLSSVVKKAQSEGYSEPDPRIDLSGLDVVRKLVILAREAGYPIEQAEVRKEDLLPASYFALPIEEFWKHLPDLDVQMEARRKSVEAQQKKMRYVATLENGQATVALKEIDRTHPFYNLEGSTNMILITTERYHDYPMVIQGYGAGADVTAAGVFADIISIANL
ncbi:MAG: bifunctional aspartate kinase/homoserine dehydrogenase I [Phocaeicola sp.]|nr:bifunctional aspartate kinase/homoserine dehydrogenase I [Phocaeicola sp.]MDY5938396.1 bifunctional aspartate kinase/homoserine dehydrogenase I [Phocaeicola sp.]